MAVLTRRLLVPAVLLLAGCTFSPSLGSGDIRCGDAGECPPGFTCVVGRCFSEPVSDGGACLPFTCDELGACGKISNGCGGTIDCGGCKNGEKCGGAGVKNVCGCEPGGC